MILGNGIDIVDFLRFKKTFDIFNEKFSNKILNIEEKQYFTNIKQESKVIFLAKHWSVKESVSKSIGCGLLNGSRLHFKDIILIKNNLNKPIIKLNDKLINIIKEIFKINNITKDNITFHISISGDSNFIITSSILEFITN